MAVTGKNLRWPDPDRPGWPLNPEVTGPHALRDEAGDIVWAWWTHMPPGSSFWILASPAGLHISPYAAAHRLSYAGPAALPE
ncbi:hypothetical protein GOB93_19610 [Acetobacter musti]|uniref:Uncharacterized protein n=1 Tax=Acetobacter musti TaxID=864732 RepID=A0ABX0JUB3_9PROT|nr:hypothetical protein [Acetobacter musti]NHN86801.1 hypothetical protein [Acetobacter musti]